MVCQKGPSVCTHTVWKFHDFSITENLREINFDDSRSANSEVDHFTAIQILRDIKYWRIQPVKKFNFWQFWWFRIWMLVNLSTL